MTMRKVTNNTKAPRGVYAEGALKWVQPGNSITAPMTDAEVALPRPPELVIEDAE